MRFTFKVTYADGREVEAVAKPKDIMAFERQYEIGFAEMHEHRRLEHLYYLAWSPLHRQGREPRAFDEFMDDIEDIEEVEGAPAVPFDSAPSDETSPDSP